MSFTRRRPDVLSSCAGRFSPIVSLRTWRSPVAVCVLPVETNHCLPGGQLHLAHTIARRKTTVQLAYAKEPGGGAQAYTSFADVLAGLPTRDTCQLGAQSPAKSL
jgi:hypothetical protein